MFVLNKSSMTFQDVAGKTLAKKCDFSGVLLARIGLTAHGWRILAPLFICPEQVVHDFSGRRGQNTGEKV